MNPRTLCVLLLSLLLCADAALAKPRLHILRASRGNFVSPVDISADGRVIVGATFGEHAPTQSFQQSGRRRRQIIEMPLPVESGAAAVSADGTAIVGFTYSAASFVRGYRWTRETGVVDLSPNPDLILYAYGLSADGRVAVGEYEDISRVNNHRIPFYWTPENGLQPLTAPQEGGAICASQDGTVIAGYVTYTNSDEKVSHACRWVNHGPPELLVPAVTNSDCTAITPDGSIIIGNVNESGGRTRNFRWINYYGAEWIDTPQTLLDCKFWDTSADGRRMVGYGQITQSTSAAVLWTELDGVQILNDIYQSILPRGTSLQFAYGISADGRWIVGDLTDAKGNLGGYILDTGRPAKP